MARTFSAEEARQAIKEHGFFAIQDQEIGLRFSEMEKKKSSFSLKTIEGFHFCKVNVLMEKVSLVASLSQSLLTVLAYPRYARFIHATTHSCGLYETCAVPRDNISAPTWW